MFLFHIGLNTMNMDQLNMHLHSIFLSSLDCIFPFCMGDVLSQLLIWKVQYRKQPTTVGRHSSFSGVGDPEVSNKC